MNAASFRGARWSGGVGEPCALGGLRPNHRAAGLAAKAGCGGSSSPDAPRAPMR